MKKSWSLFVVLMAAVVVSTSTLSAAEKTTFGITGGLHRTNIAIDPDPTGMSWDPLFRANVGGFAEFGFTPNLSFQTRTMYVRKGVSAEERVDQFSLSAEASIDYITVPLLLKLQAETAKIRPYVLVGPELGFKVRSKATVSTKPPAPNELVDILEKELTDQVNDGVRSTDFALDFGGGVEIPARGMSFLVEAIYSLGLLNIDSDSDESGSAKTRTFLVNAGIRF